MTHQNPIAQGGKSIYGAAVGILMLEAQFPRIPGDMGNALSWPFPVHYKVVRGASPDLVVRRRAENMLNPFIDAARELVADGVDGITTNCGFLALFQAELAAAVPVPVLTSSLMQWDMVARLLPDGKRPGIMTISASSLSPDHLIAAGIPTDASITTTEGRREFSRAILDNEAEMNVDLARQDNIDAAKALAADPTVGAIIMECTNMIPYAADIRHATGLPVFSIYQFVTWFQASLTPPRFPHHHQ
ncbi:MAG: aspartate/glutamate racemase family protein [Alphaproteobacteria bacterium]|nr:aspartate/glutamate racemase family protein [Alphaproteobacteria bacterium]